MVKFIQLESLTFFNFSKNNSSSWITMYPIINMLMVMGVVWFAGNVCIAQTAMMQNDDIAVRYESSLKPAAEEISGGFTSLRTELEEIFGWDADFSTQVILIKSNAKFQGMTGSGLIVAFAVPENNAIVIDYSKMNTHPFTLRTVMKHELCHLLLHHHIDDDHLPKWLDEGVCQWVSDGIAEIAIDYKRSVLNTAILSERQFSLSDLTHRFPKGRNSMILAYEESKSIIEYVNRNYGRESILEILGSLKDGQSVEAAIYSSLAVSLDELEKEWLDNLRDTPRWIAFIANHIYGILFFMAAIFSMIGFIRLMIQKRAYKDVDDEDD